MWVGLQWRGMLEGGGLLGNAVLKELESLIAAVSAWSNVQHTDDGTHTNVTATSVTITAAAVSYALRVVSGLSALGQGVSFPGVLTPDQVTADQNDYSPTGLDAAFCIRLSTDATRNITGLQLGTSTNPIAGRLLLLTNVGSNDLVLKHEDSGSTAAYRFNFADSTDITLTTLSTLLLYYDPTAARWIALGGSGSGGGTTPHDLLSDTHPDTTPASPPHAGSIIVAERSISGAVDSLKYWADGTPYPAISDTNVPGGLAYWIDGTPGSELVPDLSTGDVKWTEKLAASVGDVLTLVFEDGQLKPDWQSPANTNTGSTGAKAYRSTDLTGIVQNASTPVPMTNTEFDTGGYWSAGVPTGFTVSQAGIYMVVAQVKWPYLLQGFGYAQIFVNGTKKAQTKDGFDAVDPAYGGDADPHQVSAILNLNAGDFVEFRAQMVRLSGAALSIIGGSNDTWISIVKVG